MDFVCDNLFNGHRFRCLTVVDNFSRFCQAIRVGKSLKGSDVVEVMETLKIQNRMVPDRIQVDNGSEFISKDLDKWAYENKVTLDYSRPGKPTDNPFIESFNGSFRDECLNTHWFLSLEDAYEKISNWVEEYNHYRPHSSLNGKTPAEVVEQQLKINRTENKSECLRQLPGSEGSYFKAAKNPSAPPENTYLQNQVFITSNSPNSPI